MIPKSFHLGGKKIKVSKVSNLLTTQDAFGLARFRENDILLQSTDFPEDNIEQTFYHELVHMILHFINEQELNGNEQFVDNFSQYLYQFMKTKKK